MAGEVGQLTVNLGLNAAGFSGGITEAGKAARKCGQDIKQGMDEGKYSMMEARHAVSMLGEEFGVHIPRGISTMLASLSPVGSLMAAAFPIVAVTLMIGLVGKLVTKHEELANALRKATSESDNMAIKQADQTKALEVTNLKLDDQIAKLTHSPGNNALKEMILEDSEAVDKLAESFDADFQKVDAKITDATTLTATFMAGIKGLHGISATDIANATGFTTTSRDAILAVQDAMVKVADVRRHLADSVPGSAEAKQYTHDLGEAYKEVETKATAAKATIYDNPALLVQISDAATSAANAYKDLAIQNEIAGKHRIIKPLEDAEALTKDNREVVKSIGEMMDAYVSFGTAQREAARGGKKDEAGAKATEQTLEQFHQIVVAAKEAGTAELEAAKVAATGQEQVNAALAAQQIARIKENEAEFKVTKKQALQEEIQEENAALKVKVDAINKGADAEKKVLQEQIDAAQKARQLSLAIPGVSQNDPKILAYNNEINGLLAKQGAIGTKAQTDISVATTRTDTAVEKLNADIKQTENSWGAWARQTTQDVSSLGQVIATMSKTMQNELGTALTGFSNALAKTIVEGKSLGNAMKNVAKEMAESFISAATQMLVKYIMLKLGMGAIDKTTAATNAVAQLAADKVKVVSAAGVAGAQGTASWAGAPWPIDAGAPAFGASMAATALGFGAAEQGGLVGYDDMIIAAHKNEMVLPANLSQKVQNMTDDKKGGTTVHVHYSPTVHAIDGKGIGQVLNEHSSVIQAHVQKALRRTNKG
jgi:hypothetical protein